MMDEDSAGSLPEMAVLVAVVDQGIARAAMFALESCRGGDHLDAGKMPFRPAPLLRLGPVASRQARQDHRVEMPDRPEQLHGIGEGFQAVEEVLRAGEFRPEPLQAESALVYGRRHAED